VSTQTGATVQLLGVSISGLEQGATALNTSDGDYFSATDPGFAQMASWNMNVVRIPLNEDTWLGIHNCSQDGGSAATLQSNLKQIVANANANGLYVILDLHWSAPNAFGCPVGQASMPDADNSVNFWTSVANTFKGNPAVMFEMFNEPFGSYNYGNAVEAINGPVPAGQSATDLSILQNGGSYDDGFWYQCNGGGGIACPSGQSAGNQYDDTDIEPFTTAGMQQMLNAIRGTGAKNVVISNSIWWAGEIETWLSSHPNDPAGQLAAGWHEDGGGSATTTAAGAVLAAGYPIIITEGYTNSADTQAVTQTNNADGTNYFTWATGNHVGYLFWAWVPWGGTVIQPNSAGNAFVPGPVGATLQAAYCAQPIVNTAASCN
jgi:endoglucanase